jgi:hypothetical protein
LDAATGHNTVFFTSSEPIGDSASHYIKQTDRTG